MSVRLPGRTISIHAPRTGSDGACRWRLDSPAHFNPRSPHGERPRFTTARCAPCSFQSTLPARGATVVVKVPICRAAISIHAPRTGSDEHDLSVPCLRRQFQSTLPARGATRWHFAAFCGTMNFNPRSPHGERLLAAYGFRMAGVFQSTLPARGATDADVLFLCNVEFQSTLPARGATRVTKAECLDLPISIHAPRTGSDPCTKGGGADPAHFNPRSPHGERHGACAVADTIKRFQSTLPARGATAKKCQ